MNQPETSGVHLLQQFQQHLSLYQEEVLCESVEHDGLTVLGRGLGLQRLVAVLVWLHQKSERGIQVIINSNDWQRKWICKEISYLRSQLGIAASNPIEVNNEKPPNIREEIYSIGGSIFVTTRILVVDLLNKRLNPNLICGIVILNAHQVSDSSGEGFAVRLFRNVNKRGYVRAFSDDPVQFSGGFSKAEKVMKALFVTRLSLWPRYNAQVKTDLEKNPAEVVEISVEMSASMIAIQNAITKLIETCIREIQKKNKIDCSELDIRNALFRNFEQIIRRQLDPIWHSVGSETSQAIRDLHVLQKLAAYLLRYNPIQFLNYLECLKSSEGKRSSWMFYSAAFLLMQEAKNRVYYLQLPSERLEQSKSQKDVTGKKTRQRQSAQKLKDKKQQTQPAPCQSNQQLQTQFRPVLEGLPKWEELTNVLLEIQQEILQQQQTNDYNEGHNYNIAVLVKEKCEIEELQCILAQDGPKTYLQEQYDNYMLLKNSTSKTMPNKSSSSAQFKSNSSTDIRTLLKEQQSIQQLTSEECNNTGQQEPVPKQPKKKRKLSHNSEQGTTASQQQAAIGPSKSIPLEPETQVMESCGLLRNVYFICIDSHEEWRLWEIKPQWIILYEVDLAVMRQIELYNAELQRMNTQRMKRQLDDSDRGNVCQKQADQQLKDGQATQQESDTEEVLNIQGVETFSDGTSGVSSAQPAQTAEGGSSCFEQQQQQCQQPEQRCSTDNSDDDNYTRLKVYLLMYDMSLEKAKYLQSVERERDAMAVLIRQKGNMVLQADEGGLQVVDIGQQSGSVALNDITRKGGQIQVKRSNKVIVDIREFVSHLPAVLHQQNMQVVPVTLEVGDYVLCPGICVERKAVPDLFQSLNSGRLHRQAEMMARCYETPILSIEFQGDRQFALQSNAELPQSIDNRNVISKLCVLWRNFPSFRMIWARSLHFSAEIFSQLKEKRSDPVEEDAVNTGKVLDDDNQQDNQTAVDVLKQMPGVTDGNYRQIMQLCPSQRLADLPDVAREQLEQVMGKRNASLLLEFLNTPYKNFAETS